MFQWIKEHAFETMAFCSIVIILFLALFRINKKGSWSDTYYYLPHPISKPSSSPKKDSLGETKTREFLEKYFRKSFVKTRPNFLSNQVTGNRFNLEFDCYNEELKLAVEYNGRQHYEYVPFFHKNKEAFYNQKYRDELKRIKCRDLGIRLIEIPYTQSNRIEDYLKSELVKLGF